MKAYNTPITFTDSFFKNCVNNDAVFVLNESFFKVAIYNKDLDMQQAFTESKSMVTPKKNMVLALKTVKDGGRKYLVLTKYNDPEYMIYEVEKPEGEEVEYLGIGLSSNNEIAKSVNTQQKQSAVSSLISDACAVLLTKHNLNLAITGNQGRVTIKQVNDPDVVLTCPPAIVFPVITTVSQDKLTSIKIGHYTLTPTSPEGFTVETLAKGLYMCFVPIERS